MSLEKTVAFLCSRALLLGSIFALLVACGSDDAATLVDNVEVTYTCNDALDLTPLALDTSACVVAKLDGAPTTSAFGFTGHRLLTFGSTDTPAEFSVTAYDLDLYESTQSAAGTELFRITLELDAEVTAYPGGFLTMAPNGTVAVGYTRDSDYGGAVLVDSGEATPIDVNAPGNYDAAWLDNTALLVHSQGLGNSAATEQGIYAWQRDDDSVRALISNLGTFSSFIARGDSVVFVGESVWPNNKIYAFTVAELKQALADGVTLDAKTDGDLVYEGEITDITAMGDGLVVLETSYDENYTPDFKSVRRIDVAVTDNTVSDSETTELILPGDGGLRPDAIAATGDLLAARLATDSEDTPIVFVGLR